MLRYFYTWTPFVFVAGIAVVLTIPWLALIVLMLVVLGVLAAFAWAIVTAAQAVNRRWQVGAHRLAPAALPATISVLANPPSKRGPVS